ncbi:MAG: DUF3343 domain-containing protein, partial [Cloacibacillus porcorum]|uniref:DUF3343 domain-containing protein n=1 Tax=Cloacibacillus porcorum TaxID=1197717 RepID=UPI0023F19A07
MECLATFDTTHMALFFEKACRAEGLSVKIVPVPRQISASCGLACSYPCGELEHIKNIVGDKEIEVAEYHKLASKTSGYSSSSGGFSPLK